tara:strand:- start:134 stop:253 length:120 start_codon:yes stop_codon:yes gene_type:complete
MPHHESTTEKAAKDSGKKMSFASKNKKKKSAMDGGYSRA